MPKQKISKKKYFHWQFRHREPVGRVRLLSYPTPVCKITFADDVVHLDLDPKVKFNIC